MQSVAEHSFSLNIRVLKIIGFYPSSRKELLCKVHFYGLFALLMCPITSLSILHYVFIADVTSFKYDDFIMVAMIVYAVKFIPFATHGNKIKNCIHYFDEPIFNVVKDKHKEILMECVSICRRNTNFFFFSTAVCVISLFIQALFNIQQLPVNVWMPRWVKNKSIYFYTEFLFVILGITYSGLACAVVDPLIAGLSCQAVAQVKILKENLQYINADLGDELWSIIKSEAIDKTRRLYLEIRKCVCHHQRIIDFVNEYQICFSQVIFSQFVGSSLIIGLLCFQISKLLTVDFNFVMMLNCLVCLFFQIFFYCYYGTQLIEEVSKSISDAIYLSRWYEYDIYSKRALITLMERSKKPMIVTAGKLFDLSLETFILILKRAYSLLAVLKNY